MELGFVFYPAADPQSAGHPRLDVNLYETPTGEHFDPHTLSLVVSDPLKGIHRLTLYHPVDATEYQVCLGRIILVNFADKAVEAFSFGGLMKIHNYPDHSLCQLTSSAPIFDMGQFAEDEMELVCQFEAELARLRAAWHREDVEFEQRLAAFDPKTLFLALTVSVQQRMRQIPASSRDDHYWQTLHTISSAVRFIEPNGQLPANSPALAALL